MTHIRGIERDVPSVDHGRMNPIGRILIGAIVVLALVPGATARQAAPAPSKPSGITVVSWTSSSLGISWKASASGVSYRVYLGSKQVASTTATTYTFTGLTCGTSYRMGVETVRAGKSSATAWVVTTTLACPSPSPPPPPPPPELAALTFVSPTADSISGAIAWEVTSPVVVDRIDFSLDGGAALWTERAAPFMFNGDPGGRLDTTTLTNGTHTLNVDGYDAAGTKIATASKTVTISNSSPAPAPPPPSAPSVSIGDVSVTEGAAGTTTATLTLTLSGPTTIATTVARSTANGTATAGSDYTAASGTVTFAAGATTAQIPVSVVGDTAVEPNEMFQVVLSAPSGLTIADGSGTVTIVNDDTASSSPPPPPPPPPPPTSGGSTFDCYGSGPNCGGLTPASCTATIAASGLQTALNSATGGAVICLNTGSSGNISLTAKAYSSDVTVQPAPGATVTFGRFGLNNVDHLRVTGVGGGGATATVGETSVDVSSGCSTDVTFDHLTYTAGAFFYQQFPCSHDQNLLWDHNRHEGNIGGGLEEGRFRVVGIGAVPSAPFGLIVSNSLFKSGCSDGFDMAGQPYGVQIGPGNEFTDLNQGGCDPNHVDPIQGLGSRYTLITGNYFHDNAGSGGILSANEPNLTVTNNVFASCCYPHSIVVKGAINNTYTHNVFIGDISWELDNDSRCGGGELVRDNVFTNRGIYFGVCTGTTYTASYNLNCFCSGNNNITGTPVFVGGSRPTTYAGYRLAAGSAGKGAASDGTDMGIRVPG